MIILLYGKDTYRLEEKLRTIVTEYEKKNPSGLNIKFFGIKESFENVEDEEKQISMFGEKRLIVLKDIFSSEKLKKDILKNYNKISSSENIFIFYQEGEIKKKEKLFLLLAKEKAQEFAPLSFKKLFSWIKGEFLKNGVDVEEEAVYKLGEMGGEDLWRLKNEIDKLSLYKKKITKEDVENFVKRDVAVNIFKTVEAIAEKDKEKALFLFYDHLEKGDNPLYLLSMIVYQFRNLIAVKDLIERGYSYDKIKTKSGLHPFVFGKTYNQVKKFSFDELKKIYNDLFVVDLKTKTGQVDPVLAIHLFLFQS
jgi:DNA polymerase III subunit delta